MVTRIIRALRPDLFMLALALGCGKEAQGPAPRTAVVPSGTPVDVVIAVDSDRLAISPLIYGSNQDDGSDLWTIRRYGGNRTTGYNWENNFSNAGSDWFHSSDLFAMSDAGLPASEATIPGRAVTAFLDRSKAMGSQSIVTLQMSGFVANDGRGTVTEAETAPSARWARAEPRKNAPFALVPDTADRVVYMDEFVNFLVQRYGGALAPGGVRWYSMDNEPGLWATTHPRIHPAKVGAAELVQRTTALASAVKRVDPEAGILGPALYGMGAYLTLADAPDWSAEKRGYDWFIDYYLAQMQAAEHVEGKRLLDVLDVHWYPEAMGDHRITDANATTNADALARLQAPRALWDSSYTEKSWIAQYFSSYLPLLPRLQRSIAQYYPGTKLSISEYNYGGGTTISGGLAQADALGAFGKNGVYIATIWGIGASDVFTSAGFGLYRDYDGQHSQYGGTSVRARSSDRLRTSVYASTGQAGATDVHAILINKDSLPVAAHVTLIGPRSYVAADVWGFDASSPRITRRTTVDGIRGNSFTIGVPALTALHLVVR